MYIIYSKIFHIQIDVFFLKINWTVSDIGSQSLHFFWGQMAAFLIRAIWFVRIYITRNSSWKNGYYE